MSKLSKLTVEPKAGVVPDDPWITTATVQLVAGGFVRRAGGRRMEHYTERPHKAEDEWEQAGYTVLSTEEVELGPRGLRALLEDLARIGGEEE